MASLAEDIHDVDWNKCSLCQRVTDEKLQDPHCSKQISSEKAYKIFAGSISKFIELGDVPISLEHLEKQGDTIEVLFIKHSAKWHKTCKLKFNGKELKRATKRSMRHDSESESETSYEPPTRRKKDLNVPVAKVDTCFFCDKEGTVGEDLHEASTFTVDMRVRECALLLGDMDLVRKLSAGDMRAQDAKYHRICLVSLYNRKRSHKTNSERDEKQKVRKAITLAELIAHIDELSEDGTSKVNGVTELKLADLTKLYKARLEQLQGYKIEERIHSTELKNKILAHFPDMGEYKVNNHVHLAFQDEVGLALKQAFEDRDSTTVQMANCAQMIRKDILSNKYMFTGTFESGCQTDSIPPTLLSFVQMLLIGPNIKSQTESGVSQAAKTICQIIQYNTYKRKSASNSVRHNRDRETPLSLYTGIMVHGKTRNKELIDTLFKLGVSVSYDRVLSISTHLANPVIDYFENDGAVCPPALRQGIFTIGAYDNFDHNPSSTSAKTSTHGTSISLFQETTEEKPGIERPHAELPDDGQKLKSIKPLPENYATVPAAALQMKNPPIPQANGRPVKSDGNLLPAAVKEEHRWLHHVTTILEKNEVPQNINVSWAAFNANEKGHDVPSNFISSIMPLFYEQAKSVAMIQHGINVIKQATHLVHPGQTPVIAMDQPLFALAKQIQWDKPEEYGEDKLLIMFGGFHIESALEKVLGDWLDGSGWTEALSQAKVSSSGTADSFLKGSNVVRTRHAHQVTAAALYNLLQRAYSSYKNALPDNENAEEFLEWCNTMCNESPQFKYWFLTLDLEITLLLLVKSFRERNFMLYKDALSKIIPWFFALDHYNYSRWLPIHARDMASLREVHPSVADEFEAGKFSFAKTNAPFSAMAIDQAHEQNNGVMKADGGTVGLTENPAALKRWMVAGPEMARIINEFEVEMDSEHGKKEQTKHHEQTPATQKAFLNEVQSLADKLVEMGSPFAGDKDLYNIDTKDILDQSVIDTINSVEKLGQEQYDKFVKERLVERTVRIEAPIHKNKLPLFTTPKPKIKSKSDFEKATLTSNCNLYSNLYVSSLSRGGDLSTFFKYENQAYPPSLTKLGGMRSTKKSDLVDCLLQGYEPTPKPDFDVGVLDGAAIVNMLEPIRGQTFHQYAINTFMPYIMSYQAGRIDVVWDMYLDDSLKENTREKRGDGKRRKVEAHVQVPRNWQEFLRDSRNKTELFMFLGNAIISYNDCNKVLVSTLGKDVGTNKPDDVDLARLQDCTHEEADTRIILHAKEAQNAGYRNVLVRTVDTDVLVVSVAMASVLDEGEVWILFGKGNSTKYINVHTIANNIGHQKAKGLPVFHALTGCDQVSSFSTIGKKTAWDAWRACQDMNDVFGSLAEDPTSIDQHLAKLEHFVVICYNRVSERVSVNEERQYLFTKKGRDVNSIPPTQAALHEHIKRAVYQGGCCWSRCTDCRLALPDPAEWGWKREGSGKWVPVWTTIEEASKALRELVKCGCKQGCSGRCKCKKSGLKCTALCFCDNTCTSDE